MVVLQDEHSTDAIRAVVQNVNVLEKTVARWVDIIHGQTEQECLETLKEVFSVIEQLNHNSVLLTAHSTKLTDMATVIAYHTLIRGQSQLVMKLYDALEGLSERLESRRIVLSLQVYNDTLSSYRRYQTTKEGTRDLGPVFAS